MEALFSHSKYNYIVHYMLIRHTKIQDKKKNTNVDFHKDVAIMVILNTHEVITKNKLNKNI